MAWWHYAVPVVMVVAVWIAYRIGQRSRAGRSAPGGLHDAQVVVRDLEQISQQVRRSLVAHHASIVRFKERVGALTQHENSPAWRELATEADRILQPTLDLAHQIARAYDEIRQQTNQLTTVQASSSEVSQGLSSRRSMEDILRMLFAMKARHETLLSVALVDIDEFQKINLAQGPQRGDEILQQFADVVRGTARESDVVVKYGGGEFLVILPETDLAGAGVFANRVRRLTAEALPVTVSIGIAEAGDDDVMSSLLSKADTALYSAKAAGKNRVFRHTGRQIEFVPPPLASGGRPESPSAAPNHNGLQLPSLAAAE